MTEWWMWHLSDDRVVDESEWEMWHLPHDRVVDEVFVS